VGFPVHPFDSHDWDATEAVLLDAKSRQAAASCDFTPSQRLFLRSRSPNGQIPLRQTLRHRMRQAITPSGKPIVYPGALPQKMGPRLPAPPAQPTGCNPHIARQTQPSLVSVREQCDIFYDHRSNLSPPHGNRRTYITAAKEKTGEPFAPSIQKR